MSEALTLGVVTDLHFGPAAFFDGKLRKLSHHAGELTRAFVARMNDVDRPDLVVNLGDDIEDESLEADRARYGECQAILHEARAERVHVAGNHDTVHLSAADLAAAWREPEAPVLYRSFDRKGVHLVVLHTRERKDLDVSLGDEQLAWLDADLAATALPVVVLMHHAAADQDLRGNRWFERAPHLCLVRERRRFRALLRERAPGRVLFVMNGHLHWNHLDVIEGVPYVTLQSLVENLDEDAPGRPAAAHAFVRIERKRVVVEVRGEEPARYQFQRPTADEA